MRKLLVPLAVLPLLASCAVADSIAGEKRYQQTSPAMEPTIKKKATIEAKVVKAGDSSVHGTVPVDAVIGIVQSS